jgi:hypothetical protein
LPDGRREFSALKLPAGKTTKVTWDARILATWTSHDTCTAGQNGYTVAYHGVLQPLAAGTSNLTAFFTIIDCPNCFPPVRVCPDDDRTKVAFALPEKGDRR